MKGVLIAAGRNSQKNTEKLGATPNQRIKKRESGFSRRLATISTNFGQEIGKNDHDIDQFWAKNLKKWKNFGFTRVNLQIAPYFSIFLGGGNYAHLGGGGIYAQNCYIYSIYLYVWSTYHTNTKRMLDQKDCHHPATKFKWICQVEIEILKIIKLKWVPTRK